MSETILIPVYLNRISPLFDVSADFILAVNRGGRCERSSVSVASGSYRERIEKVLALGTDMVICSAVSRIYLDAFLRNGIDCIRGIIGNADDVIESYLKNNLVRERFSMPGCRSRGRGRQGMGRCQRYSDYVHTINKEREVNPMKIAITTQGDDLNSPMDARFGRASGFIIYNQEDGSFIYQDNMQNLNAMQGAGIQSARNIIDSGAGILISGNVGPKAFATLNAAGIEMYTGATGSVTDAIEQYKKGNLSRADNANVESHW